jgi:hypothetical protein
MLFWELNLNLLKNVSLVTLKGGEKATSTIYNNKSELLVIFKKEAEASSIEC